MEIKATLSETLDETPEDSKDIKKAIAYWNSQFIAKNVDSIEDTEEELQEIEALNKEILKKE